MYVSWCGPLWVHLVWDSLGFLYLYVYFLNQGKEVFCHYVFTLVLIPCSPSSPSGAPMIQMLICLKLSERLLILSSFFFLFWLGIFCFFNIPNCWFDPWFHLLYCWFPIMYSSLLTGSFLYFLVLFLFPIPLLIFLLSSSTPSLRSLRIFITNVLNSIPGRLLVSTLYSGFKIFFISNLIHFYLVLLCLGLFCASLTIPIYHASMFLVFILFSSFFKL